MDCKTEIAKLRFYSKIKKCENDCWEWIGTMFNNGYGAFALEQKPRLAHRMMWFYEKGIFPTGVIIHSCDNRKCVNIDHLRDGTQYENIHDMIDKGRRVINYSENNGNAKLTFQQAQEIRERFRTEKGLVQHIVAKEYGVNRSVISRIIHNKIYTISPEKKVPKE